MLQENKTKLTAIIVDDEEGSRKILQHLIEEYCPQLEIMDTAPDVLSGIKLVDQVQPDIVFLDIEMPSYSGFRLVEHFEDQPTPKIVFTTAYEEYAFKAFKVSAAGYLLKPIDIDELIKLVDMLAEEIDKERAPEALENSLTQVMADKTARIVLSTRNGLIYLNLQEICYLKSDGRNTTVCLTDQSQLRSTHSLKECQEKLKNTTFLRVHRSYIINLAYLKKYSRGRDSYVILDDDTRIDVGKNYKEELSKVVSFFLK